MTEFNSVRRGKSWFAACGAVSILNMNFQLANMNRAIAPDVGKVFFDTSENTIIFVDIGSLKLALWTVDFGQFLYKSRSKRVSTRALSTIYVIFQVRCFGRRNKDNYAGLEREYGLFIITDELH